MSRGIQQATCVPNLKNLFWFMRPWLQKMGLTYFWLQIRSKWPNCDATQTRHVVPPTEFIYQVSNWYLKACSRKVRKTRTDGRTDRRTDGHCHGMICPFFKRAYKNYKILRTEMSTTFKSKMIIQAIMKNCCKHISLPYNYYCYIIATTVIALQDYYIRKQCISISVS